MQQGCRPFDPWVVPTSISLQRFCGKSARHLHSLELGRRQAGEVRREAEWPPGLALALDLAQQHFATRQPYGKYRYSHQRSKDDDTVVGGQQRQSGDAAEAAARGSSCPSECGQEVTDEAERALAARQHALLTVLTSAKLRALSATLLEGGGAGATLLGTGVPGAAGSTAPRLVDAGSKNFEVPATLYALLTWQDTHHGPADQGHAHADDPFTNPVLPAVEAFRQALAEFGAMQSGAAGPGSLASTHYSSDSFASFELEPQARAVGPPRDRDRGGDAADTHAGSSTSSSGGSVDTPSFALAAGSTSSAARSLAALLSDSHSLGQRAESVLSGSHSLGLKAQAGTGAGAGRSSAAATADVDRGGGGGGVVRVGTAASSSSSSSGSSARYSSSGFESPSASEVAGGCSSGDGGCRQQLARLRLDPGMTAELLVQGAALRLRADGMGLGAHAQARS